MPQIAAETQRHTFKFNFVRLAVVNVGFRPSAERPLPNLQVVRFYFTQPTY